MKEIKITLSDEYTKLNLDENITELDVVLGMATLFDRLSSDTKKLVLKKFARNIKLDKDEMLED